MKVTKDSIFCEYGFMIKHKRDDVFFFEDLNPQASFARKLTRFERLQICLFFFKSIFKGN